MRANRPPTLLVKTLAVTFVTVFVLLLAVFAVVSVIVRDQVRESVAANLESGQHIFAALEARRLRELRIQAAALAESPQLKAAADTYSAEVGTSDEASRALWLETMQRELDRVAAAVEADALVLADPRQNTLASAGRAADRWPRGGTVTFGTTPDRGTFDGIVQTDRTVFHVVAVPFQLEDIAIGTLYLATALDQQYAEALSALVNMRTVIMSERVIVAGTLPRDAARQFESDAARRPVEGTTTVGGDAYAFRRLVAIGGTDFYALVSIDESSRAATAAALRRLAIIGVGAFALALVASFWLARMLSRPIGRLSVSLAKMAESHLVDGQLPLSGSSRELDVLTETFNTLMASVGAAEEQTQAAYTGAIRALAAALDARDGYTAGHSERVSVLSVAIGRTMQLSGDELEVLRLGALLHDIGKIGVPDCVLLKPSRLTLEEFDIIKQHPVLGARILSSVPFLAPHISIVELHHERPDGRGYPRGLRGTDIPVAARIVHVADAYDAMTSARAYRDPLPNADVLSELWHGAGTDFDPDAVAALMTLLPDTTLSSSEFFEPLQVGNA